MLQQNTTVKNYFIPLENWERFVNICQLGKLLSATTTSFTSNFTAYTTFSLPSHRISQGIPLIPIIATDLLASFSDSQREVWLFCNFLNLV